KNKELPMSDIRPHLLCASPALYQASLPHSLRALMLAGLTLLLACSPDQAPQPTAPDTPALDPVQDLQTRLLDAAPGEIIELPAGTFSFERSLTLNIDGVTLRGAGMAETILSFKDQVAGAEGLLVNASDFTIEDLAIE